MGFDFGQLLQQYVGGAQNANADKVAEDFHQVTQAVPADALGSGVAEALRSEQTPPFSQMVGQLFDNSNPQQRAGMLNELVRGINPSVLASLGGVFSKFFGGANGSVQPITPEDASAIHPDDVTQLAAHAEQQNPGIIDKMGQFYAAHPTLVKTIGSAALMVVMRNLAQRNQTA